jgi:hypothetical protein
MFFTSPAHQRHQHGLFPKLASGTVAHTILITPYSLRQISLSFALFYGVRRLMDRRQHDSLSKLSPFLRTESSRLMVVKACSLLLLSKTCRSGSRNVRSWALYTIGRDRTRLVPITTTVTSMASTPVRKQMPAIVLKERYQTFVFVGSFRRSTNRDSFFRSSCPPLSYTPFTVSLLSFVQVVQHLPAHQPLQARPLRRAPLKGATILVLLFCFICSFGLVFSFHGIHQL